MAGTEMAEFRGIASTNAGTAANVTVNVPAGTVNGDVMVAVITQSGGNGVQTGGLINEPSGWTFIREDSILDGPSGTEARLHTMIRVANSEPASYTFTTGNVNDDLLGAILSYSGVDTVNSRDVAALGATGTSANPLSPAVTTVTARAMVISAAVFGSFHLSFDLGPANMITRLRSLQGSADTEQFAVGTFTPPVWTNGFSVVGAWCAQTIVLRSVGHPPVGSS
jgi:hypothetical protein